MADTSTEDALIEYGNTFGARMGPLLGKYRTGHNPEATIEPFPLRSSARVFNIHERDVIAHVVLKPDAFNAVPEELVVTLSQYHEFGKSGIDEERQAGDVPVGFDIEYSKGRIIWRKEGSRMMP